MKTVLVADDEDFLRLLITQTLDAFRVVEARDGDQALEMIFAEPPDLVILDWMMPERDGPSVLKALRECEETRGIPVLMVTGKVSQGEQQHVLDLGAQDCIAKPFSPIELRKRVEALLSAA